MNCSRRTVFTSLVVFLVLLPAFSFGQVYLLYEDFERPVGTVFPWVSYGHPWLIHPTNPNQPRWDIERNSIYHNNGNPNAVTSVWCVGSDSQLVPGIDPYPGNVVSHLYWGPFNAEDFTAVTGSFWYWADVEDNSNGDGDRFMLGIKQGPFSPAVGDWDLLYELNGAGDQTWHQANFDLSQAESGDTTVSYVGMNNLYIDFIFVSDDDNNDHLGVFVDDVSMFAVTGMFDLDLDGIVIVDPVNHDIELNVLIPGQEFQVKIEFEVFGEGETPEVWNAVYDGNNQVIASHRQGYTAQLYGENYEHVFAEVFTTPDVDELEFSVYLDAMFELTESDETNNYMVTSIPVVPPVSLVLTPHDYPIEVGRGDTFFYDFELTIGSIPRMIPGVLWTEAMTIDNTIYGPFFHANMQFWPGMTIDVTNIGVTVPLNAPLGEYEWHVNIGPVLGNTFFSGGFTFTVIDRGVMANTGSKWLVTGMDALETQTGIATVAATSSQIDSYALNAAYPNPFNPSTTVSVQLPEAAPLTLKVFNVAGQQVAELANGSYPAGDHAFTFNAAELASGLYFIHATVPAKLDQVQKVMLVR